MISIRYDSNGATKSAPMALSPGDNVSFELISLEQELTDANTCELILALEKPVAINQGEFVFTWNSVSTAAIPASDCNAYTVGLALNALSSIVTAGGVDVSAIGDNGNFAVTFREVGSRTNFTITHSVLGALTGRSIVITAGSGSLSAHFEFDLSAQVLARDATVTEITGAALTVTNIATGGASTAQRDKITLSRVPDYGKMQIWTASDTATVWLRHDASAYEVQTALDNIEPDQFTVSRGTSGESVFWDVRRNDYGVNIAPTVRSTFLGPIGLAMSLDLSKAAQLMLVSGVKPSAKALISFTVDSVRQFSQPVDLSPIIREQVQPL